MADEEKPKPAPRKRGGRSTPTTQRASGAEQVAEVVKDESAKLEEGVEVDLEAQDVHLPEEETIRRPAFRSPGFSRMRTDWHGDDRIMLATVERVIDDRMIATFADAYELLNDLFEIVREFEIDDETGKVRRNRHGHPVFARTSTGGYIEDWGKLTSRHKEDFLFRILTRLVAWEELAAKAWAEAMFARARWEEHFSIRYQDDISFTAKPTIDDRTAHGKAEVADDRYFAVYVAAYSRRADALVRSMRSLEQRLTTLVRAG